MSYQKQKEEKEALVVQMFKNVLNKSTKETIFGLIPILLSLFMFFNYTNTNARMGAVALLIGGIFYFFTDNYKSPIALVFSIALISFMSVSLFLPLDEKLHGILNFVLSFSMFTYFIILGLGYILTDDYMGKFINSLIASVLLITIIYLCVRFNIVYEGNFKIFVIILTVIFIGFNAFLFKKEVKEDEVLSTKD